MSNLAPLSSRKWVVTKKKIKKRKITKQGKILKANKKSKRKLRNETKIFNLPLNNTISFINSLDERMAMTLKKEKAMQCAIKGWLVLRVLRAGGGEGELNMGNRKGRDR